jgi:hypothetical protein
MSKEFPTIEEALKRIEEARSPSTNPADRAANRKAAGEALKEAANRFTPEQKVKS